MIRRKDDPETPSYDTRVVEGPDLEVVQVGGTWNETEHVQEGGVEVSYEPGIILLLDENGQVVGGITEYDYDLYWEEV